MCFFLTYFCFFSINTEKIAIPSQFRKYIHTFSRDFLPINYGIILVINQLQLGNYNYTYNYHPLYLHNVTCTPSNNVIITITYTITIRNT